MPLEQLTNNLSCVVQFTTGGLGAAGLTVTVDVYRVMNGAHASLVTGQAATEIAKGCYRYSLSSSNTGTEGLYLFIFSTSGTADLKDIPAGWAVNTAGVENLDAAMSSRLAPTVAARTLDVSAGGEAGVDWANVGSPTTTNNLSGTTVASVTAGVTLAASAIAAVWDRLTSALTAPGSIGAYILAYLDAAVSSRSAAGVAVTQTSPLATSGTLTLKQGDDYSALDGRSIDFSYSGPGDPSSPTSLTLRLYRGGIELAGIAGTVVGSVSPWTLRFQPTAADTTGLTAGVLGLRYDVEVVKAGRKWTPFEGTLTVQAN